MCQEKEYEEENEDERERERGEADGCTDRIEVCRTANNSWTVIWLKLKRLNVINSILTMFDAFDFVWQVWLLFVGVHSCVFHVNITYLSIWFSLSVSVSLSFFIVDVCTICIIFEDDGGGDGDGWYNYFYCLRTIYLLSIFLMRILEHHYSNRRI